jgi:hypothetical protein
MFKDNQFFKTLQPLKKIEFFLAVYINMQYQGGLYFDASFDEAKENNALVFYFNFFGDGIRKRFVLEPYDKINKNKAALQFKMLKSLYNDFKNSGVLWATLEYSNSLKKINGSPCVLHMNIEDVYLDAKFFMRFASDEIELTQEQCGLGFPYRCEYDIYE